MEPQHKPEAQNGATLTKPNHKRNSTAVAVTAQSKGINGQSAAKTQRNEAVGHDKTQSKPASVSQNPAATGVPPKIQRQTSIPEMRKCRPLLTRLPILDT